MYTVTDAVPACRSLVGAILALPAILVTTACSSSAPPAPPERGALEVTTETRGERIDPDGYAIVVDDGAPRAVGVSASVTFEGLEANLIGVELTGQSSNCSVDGDNPRVISIEEGETARTTFELVCGEVSSAALLFDGSSYAIAGDAAAFDLTGTWTVEAWIKPADLDVAEQHLVSKWGTGLVGAWAFYIRNRRIQISTRIDPKNTTGGSASALVEGEWQHVAATFNNGSGRIYINGTIDAAFSGLNVPQITATPLTLSYIAAFNCCYFIGEMDEVRIWGTERSPQEIRGAMNRQLLGDEPGLRAYWKLDEGAGDSSDNAAGVGLDMQLGSAAGLDLADPIWSTPGEPQER